MTTITLRPQCGAGWWRIELAFGEQQKMLEGREDEAPSERMLLRAVIEGLRALTRPCDVRLYARPLDGYADADTALWDELLLLLDWHTVQWDYTFQRPTYPCGWCGHRRDWWRRPEERGGGWVCGNCHPNPRKGKTMQVWTPTLAYTPQLTTTQGDTDEQNHEEGRAGPAPEARPARSVRAGKGRRVPRPV